MKAKISLITLGVDDLERATVFYAEGLGLPRYEFTGDTEAATASDVEAGAGVSFFILEGTWLALYPRAELAKDLGLATAETAGFSGITLAHNVPSEEAVDAVLAQAVAAGAELIKPGQSVFWGGYCGYFRDPEGHYWEVAYNPFQDLT